MTDTTNLLIGPFGLFTGPAGFELDADDLAALITGTDLPAGVASYGDTTSGLSLNDEPTIVKAESRQASRSIDAHIVKSQTTFTFTAREVTTKRLAEWLRGTVTDASSAGGLTTATISPQAHTADRKFAFYAHGVAPDGNTYLVVAPRCRLSGNPTVVWDTEEYTEVEVEIEVLDFQSETVPNGFVIIDVTPEA